jgi:outer membrane protein
VTVPARIAALAATALALGMAADSVRAESLAVAWAMAIERDPGLAAVSQDLEAARAGERAARGARLPAFSVGAAYTQFSDAPALSVDSPGFSFRSSRIFDNDDTLNRYAELKLPLFAGGSIVAGVRAASATRLAAEADAERALADLKLDLAERYVDVLRSRAALEASAAQVAALQAHVRDVGIMTEQGAVNRSDLLASKVALANAEQQRLRAVTAVASARSAYNRRLGQPLERDPPLDERLTLPEATQPAELGTLQTEAVRNRRELQAMTDRSAALFAQSRVENGRRLPQVGLTAGYNHLETTILDRQDFSMVGLGVSWQLFDGGQARNRAAALRRSSQAMALRRNELEAEIRMQVQQAWLSRDEAQARVVATRGAEEQAAENLRMSRELYSADLIANTQVLDAVALQVAASANARDARLDADLAQLRLLHAAGQLR